MGYSFFEEVDPGVEGEIGGEETSGSLLARFVTSRELGERGSLLKRIQCVDRGPFLLQ